MERHTPDQEPNAFDRAVLREIDTIRAIGRERLRRGDEVDDFTQETLTRAYAYRDQARDDDRVGAWVRAIARNTARNWNSRRRPTPSASLPDVGDPNASPARHVEEEERWTLLLAALNALSETDRALLVAHVVEEAPYATLMARHGLSRTAIGVRLHRARRTLRTRLGRTLAGAVALFGWRLDEAIGAALMMKAHPTVAIAALILAGALVYGGYRLLPRQEPATSDATLTRARATPSASAAHTDDPGRSRLSRLGTPGRGATVDAKALIPDSDDAPTTAADGSQQPAGGSPRPDPQADHVERQRYLYERFAGVYPRYLDAIARYTQSIETRPKWVGSSASEADKAAFRHAFQAYRRDVMDPIAHDIQRYESEIQRLFPEAVTVEEHPERGRIWSLDQDAVRTAVGGRLPTESAGG